MSNMNKSSNDIMTKYYVYKKASEIMHTIFQNIITYMVPNVSLRTIDTYIGTLFETYGVVSAPKYCYSFPSYTCISLNECLCHGIADDRVLKIGDIVKLDISFKYNDIFIDACRNFIIVDSYSFKANKDIAIKLEMYAFVKQAVAMTVSVLNNMLKTNGSIQYKYFGIIFEKIVTVYGRYTISDIYGGHAIGNKLHIQPFISSVYNDVSMYIQDGDTFCLEPILSLKNSVSNYIPSYVCKDGWTVMHKDKLPTAHYENTYMRLKDKIVRIT